MAWEGQLCCQDAQEPRVVFLKCADKRRLSLYSRARQWEEWVIKVLSQLPKDCSFTAPHSSCLSRADPGREREREFVYPEPGEKGR